MDYVRFPFNFIDNNPKNIPILIVTPLDVVKTRLQAQQRVMLSNKCFLYCNGLMDHLCPCGPNALETAKFQKFNGTLDAFIKIGRSEGVKSLWSGLSPTLVLALPTTVIYFVAYEQFRVRMKDQYLKMYPNTDRNKIPFTIPLLAGSSARTLAVSIVSPLELVRTKMQSQRLSYMGECHRYESKIPVLSIPSSFVYLEVGQALGSLVKQQGVLGLWKGLRATLLRDVPFSGIYWTAYEMIKSYNNVTNPTTMFSFIGGAAAGSVSNLMILHLRVYLGTYFR